MNLDLYFDMLKDYDGKNGFISVVASNYVESKGRLSFYNVEEIHEQVFSPPFLMDASLSIDSFQDLLEQEVQAHVRGYFSLWTMFLPYTGDYSSLVWMDHQLLVPKDEFFSKYVLRGVLGVTHAYLMDLKLLMIQLQTSQEHHTELTTYYHQILRNLLDKIHQPQSKILERFVLWML
nr:augmin subunit 6 [Tanacetum cinerariifolium]